MENQATIKRLAEENGADSLVVVLGATDLQEAEISAATVTHGDPSYTGPLSGASLRLSIYHILEPELKKTIPKAVYEAQVGFMEMIADTEEIGKKFKEIRSGLEQR